MARHVGWVEQSETHQRPRWVSQGLNPSYVTGRSPLLQPRPQPFHRFTDISRSARIAEADETPSVHRIEIRAGGCGDTRDCLAASKGPHLFGAKPCLADAMYAPVCLRFLTYCVKLDPVCAAYCRSIMAMPHMGEWIEAARNEPDEMTELDVEF